MTQFKKEDFHYHGGYLTYEGEMGEFTEYYGQNGETCHPSRVGMAKDAFIARFKYASTSSRGPWINFMCKHFTVEEYLGRMAAGESPMKIMESKGFILSHIKKWMKAEGFPLTAEGYKAYMDSEVKKTLARINAK